MHKKEEEADNIDKQELWERRLKWIMTFMAITFAILIWEFLVRYYDVPHYLIPAPSKISATLWTDGPSLLKAMLFTIKLTFFFKIGTQNSKRKLMLQTRKTSI